MILPPDVGWLALVGLAAQIVDRAIGTRYTTTASALLVTLTLSLVLWLQLGRFAFTGSVALLLGALAGAPLAASVVRHLPRRAVVLSIGVAVFALAAMGLRLSLT
jgi:hypothetical protein